MELIRKHNLSAAIFAPGWTHETMDLSPDENRFDTFIDRDNAFWKTIWPYLYTHPINNPFKTIFHVGVDKVCVTIAYFVDNSTYFYLGLVQIKRARCTIDELFISR